MKGIFHATNLVGTKFGDSDFFYGVADATAQLDQYGSKAKLCSALAKLPSQPTDEQRIQNLADLIAKEYGKDFVAGQFYDSEALRHHPRTYGNMAHTWRYHKCAEVAYLQPAPLDGSSIRGTKYLTLDTLIDQCKYIFNGTEPGPLNREFVKNFYDTLKKDASNIVFLDYSDDPWAEASVKSQLSDKLPFCYTTCDGCGHCGSGGSATQHCQSVADDYVKQWLKAAKPPPAPGPAPTSAPVPPDAARFHCDKAATQCVVAVAGHSTVGACLTACASDLPPDVARYHCNTASRQCVAQEAGHSNVTSCLAACQ